MPRTLTIAASQSHTLSTTSATLSALRTTTSDAASAGVDILLFPEAYLGGYPRTCNFGTSIGARDARGKEQFLQYFQSAVDLGDTPQGAGEKWLSKQLEVAPGKDYRGDGTREQLEAVAKDTQVFLVVGLIERAGGSLYCSCVYVCPWRGCLGKRRKVMPTGTERLVWAQGQPETLKAVVADIRGVRVCLAAAICWENYMPLLRMGLYSQNVELYLAPTADGRDTWLGVMQTVACEGRCFVVSANQCLRRRDLPRWITDVADTESASQAKAESRNSRKSISQKTEEGHEIVLPLPGQREPLEPDQSQDRLTGDGDMANASQAKAESRNSRKSIGKKTEEGHEIVLPLPSRREPLEPDQPQNGLNGDETSPFSFKHTSVNEAGDIKQRGQHGNLPERPTNIPSSAPNGDSEDDFVSRGGSCIVAPTGEVLAGPLWEIDEGGLLKATVDFEDCERGRLDLDLAGSYGRLDSFELKIRGLDLNPPP